MAKPTSTPTPTPTPTAIWLLLGRALGEGVITVAVDEGEISGDTDDVEDGSRAGPVEDSSTEDLAEREALVEGVVLVRVDPRVICMVAGPKPKENSRDDWVQHSESSVP